MNHYEVNYDIANNAIYKMNQSSREWPGTDQEFFQTSGEGGGMKLWEIHVCVLLDLLSVGGVVSPPTPRFAPAYGLVHLAMYLQINSLYVTFLG